MDLFFNPLTIGLITIVILVFSAILHEVAHGFVADRLGDPTARLLGRLTLNPKSHIDPIWSVLLPFFLIISGSPIVFGAAKPVPIDPFNLKEGRKDIALVSLAGPLTNILIAIFTALILRLLLFNASYLEIVNTVYGSFLLQTIKLNLLLAIFNLIPIPPLDGSKIFALLLPEDHARAYLSIGNIGLFIVLFLMFFPIGGFSLGSLIATLLDVSLKLIVP